MHQFAVVDFDEKENLKMNSFLNKNENFKTLILMFVFLQQFRVVSRPVSASTSTGNKFRHIAELNKLMFDAMYMQDISSNGKNGKPTKLPSLEQGFQFNPVNIGDRGNNDGGGGTVVSTETQKNKWYKKEMELGRKQKSSEIEMSPVKLNVGCGLLKHNI